MSVLVSDRTESKFEAITYSVELHDMLIELMQRSFGVKDLDHFVRVKYAYGKESAEDFSKYRYLMLNYKNRIDQLASMLTSNIRAANSPSHRSAFSVSPSPFFLVFVIMPGTPVTLKRENFGGS